MKTEAKFENTDNYELTLCLTMPLSDWKELREQLSEKYPSWELSRKIRDYVSKAEDNILYADKD